ncbi:MAG TPA: guanylate kinase [Candidatus Acidoferrales bacterium]
MPIAHDPLVFIVSGPSGSGKSTLVQKLLEVPGTVFSISCTTRPRRSAEKQGEWYNFVSDAEFDRMVERGEFLEHACVFGRHKYGTPLRVLDRARAAGKDLVLEIDVQGATQVRDRLELSVAIFILPPSFAVLEKRIRDRAQDSDDDIARRLERARQEMQLYTGYDYVLVNDDLERAGREVQAIAIAERCRRAVNEKKVRSILESFGG